MSSKHVTSEVNEEEIRLVRVEDGWPDRDVAVFYGKCAKGEAAQFAWLKNLFDAAFEKAYNATPRDAHPARYAVTVNVVPS